MSKETFKHKVCVQLLNGKKKSQKNEEEFRTQGIHLVKTFIIILNSVEVFPPVSTENREPLGSNED